MASSQAFLACKEADTACVLQTKRRLLCTRSKGTNSHTNLDLHQSPNLNEGTVLLLLSRHAISKLSSRYYLTHSSQAAYNQPISRVIMFFMAACVGVGSHPRRRSTRRRLFSSSCSTRLSAARTSFRATRAAVLNDFLCASNFKRSARSGSAAAGCDANRASIASSFLQHSIQRPIVLS